MSHRKSYSEVERNKKIWKKNVIDFKNSMMVRGPIPLVQTPLMDRTRMPLKRDIICRFSHMAPDIKGRKDRLKKISKEVQLLWTKQLNFPIISDQAVSAKLEKVFDGCTRRGDYGRLDDVFDVTKLDGEWLNAEDKELYKVQLESRGQVGYSSRKCADIKTIHPSKRLKASTPASMSAPSFDAVQETDTESEPGQNQIQNLVTGTKISTSKAARSCQRKESTSPHHPNQQYTRHFSGEQPR